jgi:hypothetical protein
MQIEIQSRYAKTYKTEAGLQREVSRLEEIATANGEHLRWIKGVADNGNHAIVILNNGHKQNGLSAINLFLGRGHVITG